MFDSASIFDIPLLLDVICESLDPRDIRNCAQCCKHWYSVFGPYRLQSVRLVNADLDRTRFLLENSHHIRELSLNISRFDTFVNHHCNRLRKLTLGFVYEADEASDDDDCECFNPANPCGRSSDMDMDMDMDRDGPSLTNLNKPGCVVKLLERNKGLKFLNIAHGRGYYSQHIRPLSQSILRAIETHPFLSTIKISLDPTCDIFGKILNHLPRQLRVLDIDRCTRPVRNHGRCDHQAYLLKSRTTELGLRRLILGRDMNCFLDRMFVSLLRRCPELEVLALSSRSDRNYNLTEAIQVLNTNCKNFHTLDQGDRTLVAKDACDLLRGFSKGLRKLHVGHLNNSGLYEWIAETLVATPTLHTIEVLVLCEEGFGTNNHTLGILKNCPRLRELRSIPGYYGRSGDRMDIFNLLLSMEEEPWKCWETLEVLELTVGNHSATREQYYKRRRRRTAQEVRQLCLNLRTFPKLTTVDIRWDLVIGSSGNSMVVGLDDLNEHALKKNMPLITKEDMQWIGLLKKP
ncbi:hypothetical protein BGX31_005476 [Mortierella sp. GBA43]|nr:hypothetical protein BGX31_005476 [Mortierella sp. GBA43]